MNETRKQTHDTHKHNTNKLGIESIRREEASIFNLTFYKQTKKNSNVNYYNLLCVKPLSSR